MIQEPRTLIDFRHLTHHRKLDGFTVPEIKQTKTMQRTIHTSSMHTPSPMIVFARDGLIARPLLDCSYETRRGLQLSHARY